MKMYGNLVRLLDLDGDFLIDLKYATTNNFTGEKIYESKECYIDIETGKQLILAKDMFRKENYRVKIWDAYRPVSAQKRFWDIMPNHDFVAPPPDMDTIKAFKNSHMNGQCVDLTLTYENFREVPMPSAFDDFSERARLDCKTTDKQLIDNALYMRRIMVKAGFTPYAGEWWHFYNRKVAPAPYTDYQFE